ncbi:MAG: hypothetical protein ACO1SX_00215 [Actinomycetota bacterium]
MRLALALAAALWLVAVAVPPVHCATCSGGKPCAACKNCSSCKFCKKDGGTCGACKK